MKRLVSLLLGLFVAVAAAQTGGAPHNSVTLQWTPPTMYTDGTTIPATETITYTILAGTKSGAETQVASGVSGQTWTSPAESPGTTWFFQVVAHDVQQNSDSVPTNEVSAVIPNEVPGAPGNVSAKVN